MIESMPPEVADGGYWYVVPVVEGEMGERTPGVPDGARWCAWLGADEAVVRCPSPEAVESLGGVSEALVEVGVEGGKPYGRIEGA